jgi:glutamate/tyrosine decarboxylase-like PLP-dependent enzyme
MFHFADTLPNDGIGEDAAYDLFCDAIRTRSARLDAADAFAHMDPPPAPIAARLVGLNAAFNQNLLHREVSPFATDVERQLIAWLSPIFGMTCGHLCAGSTLANLTALWRAREAGTMRVIASADAHVSIAKSAHILGLPFEPIPVDPHGRLDRTRIGDASDSALVLTAGTTGRGVIDTLAPVACGWTHIDAAWAGPLCFSRFAARLDGIEHADSIAISAHKWLYQPKDSALILFKAPDAQAAISFGGAYLASPNVGVQGSRSAAAIPLMATLMALGRNGLAALIEKNMADAEALADLLRNDPRTELKQSPETGVVNWRPASGAIEPVLEKLKGVSSQTTIDDVVWARHVAANPYAEVAAIWARIDQALSPKPTRIG